MRRRRQHKCLKDNCDWHIADDQVLCRVHVVKIPAALAIRLETHWRDGLHRAGFGRTNLFNDAWAEAKAILRDKI